MNRKRLISGSIILTGLVIAAFVILLNLFRRQADPRAEEVKTAVSELAYCNDEQVRPCVVSFGLDADNNMLVNFLLPDHSYPDFYLQVMRGDVSVSYECQRIAAASNSAYCIGEKLPPGESLHLMLISSGDIILAEGILSIIGLAFPTLAITTATDSPTETFVTTTITPTDIQFSTRTPIPTKPSYPNTTYPNTSYP